VSQSQDRLAEVVAGVAPALKAAGFRKRRNSFNRLVGDGLVHHASFTLSSWGGGRFTIDLGVYLPGGWPSGVRAGAWINSNDCRLSWRIGNTLPGGQDRWWDSSIATEIAEAHEALMGPGLDVLDRFPDAESVLQSVGSPMVPAMSAAKLTQLDSGLLRLEVGERTRGLAELAHYLEGLSNDPRSDGHKHLLASRLRELGFADLADRAAALSVD
jgi:hypothetical protein